MSNTFNTQQTTALVLLEQMFAGLSAETVEAVFVSQQYDVDKAVDELLNMAHDTTGQKAQPAPPKPLSPEEQQQLKAFEAENAINQAREKQVIKAQEEEMKRLQALKRDQDVLYSPSKIVPSNIANKTDNKSAKNASKEEDIKKNENAVKVRAFLNEKKKEAIEESEKVRNFEIEKKKEALYKIEQEEKLKQAEIQKRAEEDLKQKEAARKRRESEERKAVQQVLQAEEEAKWKEELAKQEIIKKREKESLEKMRLEKEKLEAEIETTKKQAEELRKEKVALGNVVDDDEDLKRLQREAVEYLQHSLAMKNSPKSAAEEAEIVVADEEMLRAPPGEAAPSNTDVLVNIYIDSEKDVQVNDSKVKEIKKLLVAGGAKEDEVRVVDLSSDYELKGYIGFQCPKEQLEIPVIFVGNNYFAFLDDLKVVSVGSLILKLDRARQGATVSLFEPADLSKASNAPKLRYVDKMLNAVDVVRSYLSPTEWAKYLWSGKSSPDDAKYPVFDVIHTNWYWRHLNRRFRFHDSTFQRLHPQNNEVRAIKPYSEISKVERKTETMLVVHYGTNGATDWLSASQKDIEAMMSIFKSKCDKKATEFIDPFPTLDKSVMM